jgi:hypothetical protein
VSGESTLANKRCHREAAECATALAELALAEEPCRRESAECAATLAESVLVVEQRCHESAERAMASATKAVAEDEYTNNNYAKVGKYANKDYAKAGEYAKKGYGNRNYAESGKYTEVEYDKDDEASAPTMPPSAPLTAVSSPPYHPTSYVDAVLSTMGGSSQATSLTLAPVALPSPAIDGQLRMVRQHARPRCCVGRCHGPWAPNQQAHSLRAESSAPRPQQIYFEWIGLSREGDFIGFKVGNSFVFSDGDSFALCSFGSTFPKTIFLVEGYLLFVFLSFGGSWLIVGCF